MSWLDELRDATFRGVPFEVESDKGNGGRRASVTEFPKRDRPQIDDMGARAPSFNIEAFVIGDDCIAKRDALLAALNKAGPGELVHPTLGELRVQVGDVDWSFSTRMGGMFTFSIQFYDATSELYPRVAIDTQAKAAAQISQAESVATDTFAESFSVDGQPEFVLAAAVARLDDVVDAVGQVVATVTTLPEELTVLTGAVSQLGTAASSLVLAPLQLADQVRGVCNQLVVAASQPRAAYEALRSLFGYGNDLDPIEPSTPSRQREADNQSAIVQMVQQLATLEAARAATLIEYPSLDDAIAVRSELIEQIDALSEADIDDAVYQQLSIVRAAVAGDIRARGANLARLVKLSLPDTLPSLVLAWQLYGDASRAAELESRNRIQDPLFMPSGVPLEALNG